MRQVTFLSRKQRERVRSLAGKRYCELSLLAFGLFVDLEVLLHDGRPGKTAGNLYRLGVADLDRDRSALAQFLNNGVRVAYCFESELGEGGPRARYDGRRFRRAAGGGTLTGLVGTERRRRGAVGRHDLDRSGDERAVEEVLADVRDDALRRRVLRLRVDVEAKLANMWWRHAN